MWSAGVSFLQQVRYLQLSNWVWLLYLPHKQVPLKIHTWQTSQVKSLLQHCRYLVLPFYKSRNDAYFLHILPVCCFPLLVLEETLPLSLWTDQPLHSFAKILLALESGLKHNIQITDRIHTITNKNDQTIMYCPFTTTIHVVWTYLFSRPIVPQVVILWWETSLLSGHASLSLITSVCLSEPSKHAGVKGQLGSLFWHEISCRRRDRLQHRGRVCRG